MPPMVLRGMGLALERVAAAAAAAAAAVRALVLVGAWPRRTTSGPIPRSRNRRPSPKLRRACSSGTSRTRECLNRLFPRRNPNYGRPAMAMEMGSGLSNAESPANLSHAKWAVIWMQWRCSGSSTRKAGEVIAHVVGGDVDVLRSVVVRRRVRGATPSTASCRLELWRKGRSSLWP